ncbi:hypothetical protein DIPPA_22598 [Diplonema papillatum]|nr:hypothetical protein DIPPA_22598 [Diplonema papillatum]
MAKPVVQLWLHAREAGWPLDGFCAKLEELGVATPLFGSPGSVHSGESLSDIQERFAVYSNLEPPESTISALQDAFNAPPDDSYCTSPLTGVLSSPTTLHLTSNNLPDDDITSPYRRMPDSVPEPYLANGRAPASFDAVVTGDAEGVATRAPASFWILIAAYLSVVVAGFVLTLLSADVYSDGIPNDMRILYPLVALFSFLMIGVFVRTQSSFCRRFYIPASVVGGVIACCFIQVAPLFFVFTTRCWHHRDTKKYYVFRVEKCPG